MIDNLLLLINLDPKASPVVEDIFVIFNDVVDLAWKTATSRYNQLPLRFEGVLVVLLLTSTRRFLRRSTLQLIWLEYDKRSIGNGSR